MRTKEFRELLRGTLPRDMEGRTHVINLVVLFFVFVTGQLRRTAGAALMKLLGVLIGGIMYTNETATTFMLRLLSVLRYCAPMSVRCVVVCHPWYQLFHS